MCRTSTSRTGRMGGSPRLPPAPSTATSSGRYSRAHTRTHARAHATARARAEPAAVLPMEPRALRPRRHVERLGHARCVTRAHACARTRTHAHAHAGLNGMAAKLGAFLARRTADIDAYYTDPLNDMACAAPTARQCEPPPKPSHGARLFAHCPSVCGAHLPPGARAERSMRAAARCAAGRRSGTATC